MVSGAKLTAYEKGRREAMAEAQRLTDTQQTQTAIPSSKDGSEKISLTKEDLRKFISDEATKAQQQAYDQHQQQVANEVVNEFNNKLLSRAQEKPDFEQVVTQIDLVNLDPLIIDCTARTDNGADVLYELAKNPSKLGHLLSLSKDKATQSMAKKEFEKLSKSIKANSDAAKNNTPNVNEPLDQLKPSTNSTDNGLKSVSDLRKQDYLRC